MTWSSAGPAEPVRPNSVGRAAGRPSITLDCDTCTVRGLACGDCVVSLLIGPPPEVELDAAEQRALVVLAEGGLVPPLRLVVNPDR
jgi:hypothetical protein